MKPLTLQEAKDQVAKTYKDAYNQQYKYWSDLTQGFLQDQDFSGLEIATDAAAQLYGDSQWNAGLEKAAEIAVDTSFESLSEFNNFLEELKRLKR